MNKNILIVFGGAFLVAILVALFVQVTLGTKKTVQPVVEETKVQILVATKDLGIGRELQDGDLRWQEWPEASVFPGALVRKNNEKSSEVLTGRLARDIAKGEPLTNAALLSQAGGNFVAASLEDGMRAISIGVSAESMVSGFLGPGDYVDVILTYKEVIRTEDDDPRVQEMIEKNIEKLATETILQNVKILAVDQTAQRPEEDKIKVGKTVTLAVSVQDAERLSLARKLGDLTLVLRSVGDDKTFEKSWPTISDARLTNMDDEIYQEYDKLKEDTQINPDILRIYNGATVHTVPTR